MYYRIRFTNGSQKYLEAESLTLLNSETYFFYNSEGGVIESYDKSEIYNVTNVKFDLDGNPLIQAGP